MPAKSVTMSENGRANYQNCLDKKVYPILGDVKMPEITPAQITALLLDIQATGKAHATVIKVYTVIIFTRFPSHSCPLGNSARRTAPVYR